MAEPGGGPRGERPPTFVYVDGFNLYYRALRRTAHRWLDIAALVDHVLGPRHNVARVRYFTARVLATAQDPTGPQRQQVYLDALAQDPRISIHEGQFRPRQKTGPIVRPQQWIGQLATISTFEEKGSDVSLASWALADAYEGRTHTVVLLTNDSDLAEPVRILRNRGTPVGVIVPAPGLKPNTVPADFVKILRPGDLARSHLPDPVRAPSGREIHKPPRW